jgi:protein-disulfide isomerase
MDYRQFRLHLSYRRVLVGLLAMLAVTGTAVPQTGAANRPAAHASAKAGQVTMTLFTDYQCPACRRFDSTLKSVRAKYGNRLHVVLRNYPLPMHKNAMVAAYAAEAAARQGKLWAMHDKLYDNQASWIYSDNPVPVFTDFAKSIGANPTKFASDMKSPAVTGKVASDMRAGRVVGVQGTPTVVLNGKTISGAILKNLDGIVNDTIN